MNLKITILCFLATILISCSIESQSSIDESQSNTEQITYKKPIPEILISDKEANIDNDLSIPMIDNSILVKNVNIALGVSFNEIQSKLDQQLIKSPISDNCFSVTVDDSLSLEFFNDDLIFMSVFNNDNIVTDKDLSINDSFEKLSSIYPDLTKSEVPAIGGDESFTPITITYSTNHNIEGNYMVFMMTDDNKVEDIGVYNINHDNDVCEIY